MVSRAKPSYRKMKGAFVSKYGDTKGIIRFEKFQRKSLISGTGSFCFRLYQRFLYTEIPNVAKTVKILYHSEYDILSLRELQTVELSHN